MCHVVVSVQFFERPELVSEDASLPIETDLISVELSAVLALVILLLPCLLFSKPIALGKLLSTMSVVTIQSKRTVSMHLYPVFTHFSLEAHASFRK